VSDDVARRLDALLGVALRLARSAPSGQIALAQVERAIDLSWIPLPWGESIVTELQAAAADAREPVPFKQIERVLRDAWGGKPSDELDDLDPDPVAVTPGAQVHRGVLDGDAVAVKVLRPGLPALVRQDLSLLEGLLAPLASAFPAIDASAILREVRERVLDELDLEHEAGVQRRYMRALRRHPQFQVPVPVTRLAHPDVMVSEWIDGVPLREADDRDGVCAALVRLSLGAQRSLGIVHADIDPDDVLFRPDGRIALLDFGAVAPVAPERVDASVDGLDAFIAGDGDTLGQVLERTGALPAELGPTLLSLGRHALGPLGDLEPARLDVAEVLAARDRLLERPDDLLAILTRGAMPPADLWPARGIAQTFSTIARVGATGPWVTLARDSLRDGWLDDAVED
jgi:predicted unusual protein kinase regulating ubiquinone biosynthesis (AarF/ABC1/UbiB family)